MLKIDPIVCQQGLGLVGPKGQRRSVTCKDDTRGLAMRFTSSEVVAGSLIGVIDGSRYVACSSRRLGRYPCGIGRTLVLHGLGRQRTVFQGTRTSCSNGRKLTGSRSSVASAVRTWLGISTPGALPFPSMGPSTQPSGAGPAGTSFVHLSDGGSSNKDQPASSLAGEVSAISGSCSEGSSELPQRSGTRSSMAAQQRPFSRERSREGNSA